MILTNILDSASDIIPKNINSPNFKNFPDFLDSMTSPAIALRSEPKTFGRNLDPLVAGPIKPL